MFLRAELRCCHALVTRQCNSSSLFLECLLMTPQKKKNKKIITLNLNLSQLVRLFEGQFVIAGSQGGVPVIGFTVEIVSCTAALCNNISVRFKIFLPATEGILLDNVRQVVLRLNFLSLSGKNHAWQIERQSPMLMQGDRISSIDSVVPF